MARRPTAMKNLFSMLNDRQKVEFYELLVKIKRMYRDRLCNALILYITEGTITQFSDSWLNRWYHALLVDLEADPPQSTAPYPQYPPHPSHKGRE